MFLQRTFGLHKSVTLQMKKPARLLPFQSKDTLLAVRLKSLLPISIYAPRLSARLRLQRDFLSRLEECFHDKYVYF